MSHLRYRQRTLAMALGLTGHLWRVHEFITQQMQTYAIIPVRPVSWLKDDTKLGLYDEQRDRLASGLIRRTVNLLRCGTQ